MALADYILNDIKNSIRRYVRSQESCCMCAHSFCLYDLFYITSPLFILILHDILTNLSVQNTCKDYSLIWILTVIIMHYQDKLYITIPSRE